MLVALASIALMGLVAAVAAQAELAQTPPAERQATAGLASPTQYLERLCFMVEVEVVVQTSLTTALALAEQAEAVQVALVEALLEFLALRTLVVVVARVVTAILFPFRRLALVALAL